MTRFRLIVFCCLAALALPERAVVAQAPSSLDTAFTLDVRGLPLSEALVRLARARNLKLAYAPELVADKTSTCVTRALVVEEALRCILEGSGLHAEQLPNGVYVIRKTGPVGTDQTTDRATGSITGVVRGHPSGEILVGAHVRIAGTQLGAVSRSDGTFLIAHVPTGAHDLEVSMLGFDLGYYRQVHVPPQQTAQVNVELAEATIPLEEVVVASSEPEVSGGITNAVALDYGGIHIGAVSVGLLVGTRSEGRVQLNGLGSLARDSLDGLQFAGVFNATTGAARGAQFSGLVNTVSGDLDGAQFSGVANVTARDVHGGQVAGFVNLSRNMEGIQMSGFSNIAYGGIDGVQVAGAFNTAIGSSEGAQFGGVFNAVRSSLRGGQAAGILNATVGDLYGHQAAGAANVGGGTVSGLQVAGIVNAARHGAGWQVAGALNASGGDVQHMQLGGVANVARGRAPVQVAGFLNIAGAVDGLQLGVVNISRTHTGVPIGLVSYVHEVGLKFDVWADETGLIASAVRSGNRRFSNYLGFGTHPSGVDGGPALVAGLGTEFPVATRAYGTVEALQYALDFGNWSEVAELIKVRMTLGYEPIRHLAVFAGPTFNLLLSDDRDHELVPWDIGSGTWGGVYYHLWPGFSAGLRISTRP